ncbi:hypothetical protein [Nocardia salmonicida]|uniref:hypothetical protein n=1 Tax=Nocardia salmonicida TaxID=53431 RepID=UPI003795F183
MTPEQATELAEVARTTATSLVARVHAERPEVIWSHLAGLTPAHLIATTVVLAAMVPLTADPEELLAWLDSAPSAGVLHQARPDVPDLTDRSCDPMDVNPEAEAEDEVVIADDAASAARRVVAAHAADETEHRTLLAMLGLDEEVAA